MLTVLNRSFAMILRGGALLALLIVLASALPKAQAAGVLNAESRPAPRVRPAVPNATIDINGPTGSGAFGTKVTALSNGNFVVTDPTYSIPSGAANVGAVYLYNGATLTVISTLKGSTANDNVGNLGITVLSNGNYVVQSPNWDNPTGPIADVGAVTWCSATTGCNGAVSASNSLIGGTASDYVGNGGVTALTNGNYVVRSQSWDAPTGPIVNVGAATWGNGSSGTAGLVTSSNSLIGGTVSDSVSNGGVTALTNGNYVVISPGWDNPVGPSGDAGAATWGNGNGGTVGLVSSGNSLVGGTATNQVGSYGVTALTNGNYVVNSPGWDNPSPGKANVGAVTWGNGMGGTVGLVTSSNSLIGGTANDQIGENYGVTALTNGNYVVRSRFWNNPTGPIGSVGAVTWGNGSAGTVGLVTSSNSLIGGTANDQVGSGGTIALTNGNYVVQSPNWDNPAGPIVEVGAVTWGNGMGGTAGLVSSSNSLIGGTTSDAVGNGGVTVLTNGNYVIRSSNWDNPTGTIVDVGAVTWGNGNGGTVGSVSSGNSLIGGTANDRVGESALSPSMTALTNGNYVVISSSWDNPAGPVSNVGAVTWGNGNGGTVGLVSSGNSLIGGTANDQLGDFGVAVLTNGNYVVRSSNWDNPSGPIVGVGAVTWGNGTGGTVGLVTSSNSLIGGTTNDHVGGDVVAGGVTALTNGNYVVRNSNWDNPSGSIVDVGAVTWCNGTGGTVGLVTSSNSLIGGTANDRVGDGGVTALTNGDYVVKHSNWDNPSGPVSNGGAVTWGNGTGGTVGLIVSTNSVLGTVTNGITGFSFDAVRRRVVVGRSASNIVSLLFLSADLSNLVLSSGTLTPAFAAAATSYAATVATGPTSLTVTPTAADPTVTIQVNGATVASGVASGAINLNVGANVITVVVTALDGVTTKTYTVTVTRTLNMIWLPLIAR